MILHSDNTATDMSMKYVVPDKVREFIASAGLKNTMMPEEHARVLRLFPWRQGLPGFTWGKSAQPPTSPIVNPPLNNVETLASSARRFRDLLFARVCRVNSSNKETLNEFRRIVSMGDAIWLVPVPLGVSAFVKGGSIHVEGFHAVCVPGAMLFETAGSTSVSLSIGTQKGKPTRPRSVHSLRPAARRSSW